MRRTSGHALITNIEKREYILNPSHLFPNRCLEEEKKDRRYLGQVKAKPELPWILFLFEGFCCYLYFV
jgi:hypothetical protein